jgi:hypothetical protein
MAVIDNMDFDDLMAFEERHSIALGSSRADASLAATRAADATTSQGKRAASDVVPTTSRVSAKRNVKLRLARAAKRAAERNFKLRLARAAKRDAENPNATTRCG